MIAFLLTDAQKIERLRAYREKHTIDVVTNVNGPTLVAGDHRVECAHDHIRIFPKRGGGWRHDPDEIKQLAGVPSHG